MSKSEFGQVIQGVENGDRKPCTLRFVGYGNPLRNPALVSVLHSRQPALFNASTLRLDEAEKDGEMCVWRNQELEAILYDHRVKPQLWAPAEYANVLDRQLALIGHVCYSLASAIGPTIKNYKFGSDSSWSGALAVCVAFHTKQVIEISGYLEMPVLQFAKNNGVYVGDRAIA